MICLLVGRPTPPALDRLSTVPGAVRIVAIEDATPNDLAEAEALFIWDFRWRSLDDLWPRLSRVRWIHTASAGVDHILSDVIRSRQLTVTNSAGVFETPIAEYVIALTLAHFKGLPDTMALQREHRWQYRETRRLDGSTMLIVGMGRIGSTVALKARALGVDTIGVRRAAAETGAGVDAAVATRIVAAATLDRVIGLADVVVVTAALTPESQGLVGRRAIDAMQPSAFLINVARSLVVDTVALVDALRAGRIAGAALDVFDEEPLSSDDPLWEVPNLIISPHMSGDVSGWDEIVADRFIDNLGRWLRGERLSNVVDVSRGY